MSAISFVMNPKFEEELAADPATQAVMMTFKDTALAAAQNAAPVKTGRYRDSLYVDDTGVGSTSSFWALIEYGSTHNPPHAPLRRGVEAAGVHWSDP
jgi:hypothetical protein